MPELALLLQYLVVVTLNKPLTLSELVSSSVEREGTCLPHQFVCVSIHTCAVDGDTWHVVGAVASAVVMMV